MITTASITPDAQEAWENIYNSRVAPGLINLQHYKQTENVVHMGIKLGSGKEK